MRGRRFHGARARRRVGPGEWAVRARVERFGEPALLLLLSERSAHGYDLLEQIAELTGDRRIDMGNLYRVLRALEEDGIVTSEWRDDAPGPSKRIYELTDEGRRVLDGWADALRANQQLVSSFLDRYEKGGDHVPRT
ncbi:MAG TPA: PadR family transcriptional regulator [Gaiellaceae bacterium]